MVLHLNAPFGGCAFGARASILSGADEYFTLTHGLIAVLMKFFEDPRFPVLLRSRINSICRTYRAQYSAQ